MPLTPQEVASKVFGPTRLRRGYDENEVDAFLDQVEAELNRLTSENERLRHQLEQARGERPAGEDAITAPSPPAAADLAAVAPSVESAPSAPLGASDDVALEQLARMLVLAQQTADAAVREAQGVADRTRGSARVDAERVLSQARAHAAEEIGSLERSKGALETEVGRLQAFEREYRQRLRAYLEMQLRDLELGASGSAAVEGRSAAALDPVASAAASQATLEARPAVSDAAERADLDDVYAADPLTGGRPDAPGQPPDSPVDTGGGG